MCFLFFVVVFFSFYIEVLLEIFGFTCVSRKEAPPHAYLMMGNTQGRVFTERVAGEASFLTVFKHKIEYYEVRILIESVRN